MKTLGFNYRGLGNPETVRDLHDVVRKEDPKIVFLMETRLEVRSLEFLRIRLGMGNCFGVDRHGYGGGLALLWDSFVNLHIRSFSHHHIDAEVHEDAGFWWQITGFYGYPEVARRHLSWSLLRQLHSLSTLPWMVFGDFNEIVSLDEKWGMEDRSLTQMAAFRKVLNDCGLQDLGFHGPEHT
jgi:hypothetical protein